MSETVRMGKKSPLLSAIAVWAILAGVRKTESTAGDTYPHFKILCRLAEIARTPLKKFELADFNPEESYEAARRRAVDFGGQNETEKKGKDESKTENQEEIGIPLEEALKEAKEKKQDAEFKSSTELRKLALIVAKMKNIKQDAEKTKKDIAETEKAIRLKLAQAIYGKDTEAADFKASGGNTPVDFDTENAVVQVEAEAKLGEKTIPGTGIEGNCDGAAETHLAHSIVSDMYCVCGSGGGSASEKHCHNGIAGTASGHGQLGTLASANSKHATTIALLGECKKLAGNVTLSPQAIQAALATFFSKIGAGTGHANADYIFGVTAGAGAGSGGATPCSVGQSACVNYKPILSTTTKQIPWVVKFQEAEENLEKRALLIQKYKQDATRLHDLELAAQMIQRPTAVGTAPFARNGSQSAGAKSKITHQGSENIATVPETSASGAFAPAIISRFLLPWTLLI